VSVLRGSGPTADGPDPGRDGFGAAPEGYDTRWLDLRAGADDRSRSTELLHRLAAGLPARPHLLDVGCGSGAMQRWVDRNLRTDDVGVAAGGSDDEQDDAVRWTLLDPDPDLLAVAAARAGRPVTTAQGTVGDLVDALAANLQTEGRGLLAAGRPDALVCSALLDVLPAGDVAALVRAVVRSGVPLLAALTVTGDVALDPPHPDDGAARLAVAATASTGGSCGHAAVDVLRAAADEAGAVGVEARTPWLLDPVADAALVRAWADGYVAAALLGADRVGTELARADLASWAAQRRADVTAGRLRVTVEHVDVLVSHR
jgi:SAM-dependent methyltransferase